MNIYIDESGLFREQTDLKKTDKAWCTVGAVTVPHNAEKKVKKALLDLKRSLHVKPEEEIEKIPDLESSYFIEFIEKLKDANCTAHAMTTNGSLLNDERTKQHKAEQIQSRKNYIARTKNERSKEETKLLEGELNNISSLIEQSSAQEYNQIILQSALISFMLDKTLTYYAQTDPHELSRLTWVYDRKTDIKKKGPAVFEELFFKIMPVFVEVSFIKEPRGIPNIKNGYDYFIRNYGSSLSTPGMPNEEIQKRKKLYGADYSKVSSTMVSFDFNKLLNKDSDFHDSKKSPGIQVADLVISSINRLLRGNVGSNEKVAKILGGLLLNSPRLDLPSVPQLNFYDSTATQPELSYESLELLNGAAKEVYTQRFRQGFTKNITKFIAENINH